MNNEKTKEFLDKITFSDVGLEIDSNAYSCYQLESEEAIQEWRRIEETYGIKFKLNNGEFRPVNEVLDDIYLQEPSNFKELMEDIILHGDILFANLLTHKQ